MSKHSLTAKTTEDRVEHIRTKQQVPGHSSSYEKNSMHTYSDGEDEDVETPMNFKRIMALIAMAFRKLYLDSLLILVTNHNTVWTGSQIPVYLFGGVPPYIYADIGGTDRWIWFILANLLS